MIEYAIAAALLYFYAKSKDKAALYFGLGVLTYALAHTLGGTVLSWIRQEYNYEMAKFVKDVNYKVFESLRNVLVASFMALSLMVISQLVKDLLKSKVAEYVKVYAAVGALAFLALRLYCVWVAEDVKHPFFALAQWVFLIPGSLVAAAAGFQIYYKLKVLGGLLLGLSFLVYAAILPLYAAWKGTPMLNTWYVLRIISDVLLLAGVLYL
ncbi:hypothetical protein Igni_1031 [Ignicoccus hospitalis KIN4/I]|uniref:Uncharacterized protein n=1 Tax=Ignicoccus hospitalis (strain KIN4/I / DSM 18386 / JCM 14125) TaxID=453591 RepID=A8ABA8_IGNH4|nr:hypothetical protein Igni_1031 [Ignicoccus hospitalis KIN4/I]